MAVARAARLAVPYNLARLPGGRLVGLDAYFWGRLDRGYRVVLLVHPAERLQDEPPPGACRLEPRVAVEEQLRDLEAVSRLKPTSPPRARGPGLLERLASLIMPGRLLDRAAGSEEVFVALPSEELQARSLARMLRGAEPEQGTRWAVFTDAGAGPSILLPEDPVMARIYSGLADRDRGYREAALEALSGCRRRPS